MSDMDILRTEEVVAAPKKKRVLTPQQLMERSITKQFRKSIWNQFIKAVKTYELVEEGDHIAVCISGGKDSMLLALLMSMLQKHSDVPFELTYLMMDPGYAPINRQKIDENAALLEIPLTVFETEVFDVANSVKENPCYLCARMRRGYLYSNAKDLGCNKIALGHHFNDVIETTVMGMFYGSQLQGMMPKLHSQNFEGMELIRPLYCVHEDAIIDWRDANGLSFIQCACRFTEKNAQTHDGIGESKRQEIKMLLKELKQINPNVEKSVFNSLHCVSLDTFPCYKSKGVEHNFLEDYKK